MLPRGVGRGLQLSPCWEQEWGPLLLLPALRYSSELSVLLCAPMPRAELCRWDLTAVAPSQRGTRGLTVAASLQWVGQSSCCLWCWARSPRAAFTPRMMGFIGDPSSKSPKRICGPKVVSLGFSAPQPWDCGRFAAGLGAVLGWGSRVPIRAYPQLPPTWGTQPLPAAPSPGFGG